MAGEREDRKKPCHTFARTGNCPYGAKCKYSHRSQGQPPSQQSRNGDGRRIDEESKKPTAATGKTNTSGNRTTASSAENEFNQWRYLVPKIHTSAAPLARQLGKFFQDASRLVGKESSVMQEVIEKLASDGGLHRIREISDQITESIAPPQEKVIFETQLVPLFRTLSQENVVVSAVLEHSLGIIHNFLYGPSGHRAIAIFRLAANTLATDFKSLSNDNATAAAIQLEGTVAVLSRLVDLNGAALLNTGLQEVVRAFDTIFEDLDDDLSARLTVARRYLSRAQRRLGLASTIPEATSVSKPAVAPATFIIHQDLPGSLSRDGPRHDNDSENICNIQIMPTTQEILSSRQEYRPVNDPAQWHLQGPEGVFDRQFRLLREDTVGQLRDAIRIELDRLQNPGQDAAAGRGRQQGARTYTYPGVMIDGIKVDRWRGFEFELRFAQPGRLRKMTVKQREEWWESSKRLQADALVCLLNLDGTAVFCSVSDTRPKDPKRGQQPPNPPKSAEERTLFSDAEFAFATLRLVSTEGKDVESILARVGSTSKPWQDSLVEFPGVLLPSFQPTLLALQRLSTSGDLPFRDLIAPIDPNTAEVAEVGPPAYATSPGFHFRLRSIMGGQNLQLPVRGEFDIKKLQDGSTLDDAQAVALVESLSRSLALIQGPPGTGKSYTGVALVKVLLDNKAKANLGPIICVCYTNHALDQLLEHLVHGGVSQIVRIGSRSKSEILQPLNLRVVAKRIEPTELERRQMGGLHHKLKGDLEQMEQLLMAHNKADSWVSLKVYLEDYYPTHCAALFGVDEEGWETVHHKSETIIADWLNDHREPQPAREDRPISALQSVDLNSMTCNERAKLHRYWVRMNRAQAQRKFQAVLTSFEEAKKQYDQVKQEADLRCLQKANVIGITTTGLARNLDLLRRVHAKALLCEEAGEVLEAHILTALLPSVEHAILIGDHLQLRPQVQNYELSSENPGRRQYSLDVSLFERLVQPDDASSVRIPFSVLETQRRMHPSIAQLVRDTLYPNLLGSPSVAQYPPVAGMRRRLFWFDHSEPEANADQQQAVTTSHSNKYEVEMTASLVSHLVRQGVYQANDIAVLTPYLGQLQKLRKRLSSSYELVLNDRDLDELHKAGLESPAEGDESKISGVTKPELHDAAVSKTTLLKALKVATIDNFQGEEAKVVVISLVRSNNKNKCGFLRTSNRINVALSRAQHGMYIIGNSRTSDYVQMWSDVLTILKNAGNFGTELELQCPRHPDTSICVKSAEDFQQMSPEGGCNQKCVHRLGPSVCGEQCPEPEFCQICGSNDVKDTEVDFIMGEAYREIDLEDNPCIFPQCGHFLTIESMDGLMDMKKHYEFSPEGVIVSAKQSSEPFSMDESKTCATCRASLRNLSRYGRIVRRALLDESTKKFILWANGRYVRLAETLQELQHQLSESMETFKGLKTTSAADAVHTKGNRAQQLLKIRQLDTASRYKAISTLRGDIAGFLSKVKKEEQPFQKVWEIVQHARRRRGTTKDFNFDRSVLQTRGFVLASALMLRCDLAIMSDFVAVWQSKRTSASPIAGSFQLDSSQSRQDCLALINLAATQPMVQVEGHVFFAQYAILECSTTTTELAVLLKEEAEANLKTARTLCAQNPGQTRGMLEEIESVEEMLRKSTFTSVVTSEERRAVLAAMATELQGTGKWYTCENGHPFTVGECGMPMEMARCPQCNAQVGGRNHVAVEGVRRAEDLEAELAAMRLGD
ncbi:hypothetical protein H2201_006466 [Coniosporium apollinis]|uniref:C3H1-type domain-containing protein n=1 Tax=Coniosporium apollinis TaxID=61459 RepID=A0ABQ9NQ87_9PEZI|nr:hypothetical protein H2201_006466 [Coniosporium apollinis]